MIRQTANYIIVGAGSAGCVLANRLSSNPNNKVILIEAGHHGYNSLESWKMNMPAALTYNLNSNKYNWDYKTTNQKFINNRRISTPRGKMLGGSSSLNAMVYMRGHPLDYDRWASEGAKGWSFKDCLPYFKKSENFELGEDDYRGTGGNLNVCRAENRETLDQELSKAFIEAGVEAGYQFTDDMNGYRQEGFGYMDMTIKDGERNSAYHAYLKPVLNRKNLKLITDVNVFKINLHQENNNYKATGVEYLYKNNKYKLESENEVIVSCGAINSPKLLLLSGIGVNDVGINVKLDLPVGDNLQDHLELYIQALCKKDNTLLNWASWKHPYQRIEAGLEWFIDKSGICASNHFEVGGFIRSRAGIKHPDIQYHFLAGLVEEQADISLRHGFQAHCGTMRPKSRGNVRLSKKNPFHEPIINPNYLEDKQDVEDLREAVKLTLELFHQKAFEPYLEKIITPDFKNLNRLKNLDSFKNLDRLKNLDSLNDDDLDDFIINNVQSAYHPTSTCAIGKVVDENCLVYGTNNLRVVDASIMPSLVSGNTNAPTIMIGEKASDIILKNKPLEPEDVDYYVNENWQNRQR